MAIPIIYNIRSVKMRYASSIIAVLAIAGVVAVFVSVLAMATGFKNTLRTSGSPENIIILRGGATSEMESAVNLEQAKIIGDAPGIRHDEAGQPLISPEVVVIAAFKLRSSETDANVQVRGVSKQVLKVRSNVKIVAGRFFTPGLTELVAGANAVKAYMGMELNGKIKFGGQEWTVVGIMDSGGSAFDSEVWCDSNVLNQTYKRPENIFQSVTATLESSNSFSANISRQVGLEKSQTLKSSDPFSVFKDFISGDPRLTMTVYHEIAYYEKQSEMVSTLIEVLGFLVASIMAIGAIFGALNTMYSAVSARTVEIATLRAIGFREGSVIASFILESLFIAALGGILGLIIILPINGKIASTMNWQTFSHMSFTFSITPTILCEGMAFALIMGFLGGLFPALRASRIPVAVALRGL